ncbi:MAG: ribonuclease III domain-containing protein [Limnoraphis robusta]|uniref:Ribonuclease III domain-containing protein n=1 Tax=Limnoraphis robusta CCNP1315 TaxID=3110306 RepID=A0ABU5TXL3_9CYAN|nr:ribonuclease III domain-containing protein [Limnoraphis robusta]MEA5519574.1 ribonuclease III domain-containing protein [Limnoraphis robusta CCNP1315]MEA5547530.1 ribonuclease III domain-containing protein [Limnoraphis robusta CCNP1324]
MLINLEAVEDWVSLHFFCRPELLEIALTDPDYIAEDPLLTPAQKKLRTLEHIGLVHLGSIVLSTLVSNYLCDRCLELGLATLTVIKSDLITTETLSRFAEKMNFRAFCRLGTGYAHQPQHEQQKILAHNLEAIVGAVYLEFNRDILKTQNWLGEYFLKAAVDELLDQASLNSYLR